MKLHVPTCKSCTFSGHLIKYQLKFLNVAVHEDAKRFRNISC